MLGFLNCFLSLLLSSCVCHDKSTELFARYTHISLCHIYRLYVYFFRIAHDFDMSIIIPPPTHTSNYAIFWRGTWHICFASASLSYLVVISHLSILVHVCINSCNVCFFAPMPCAMLMENAIHCMRTQLAMHTPTLLSYFSWVSDNISLVPSLKYVFNVCSYWMISTQKFYFIQIHGLWKIAYY